MTASTFLVVVNPLNGRQRRVIVADTDAEINAPRTLLPGEQIVRLNHASFPIKREQFLAPAVATALGLSKPGYMQRCVALFNGVVTHALMADAAIDSVPHRTLLEHNKGGVGDIWTGAVFRTPPQIKDAQGNLDLSNLRRITATNLVF